MKKTYAKSGLVSVIIPCYNHEQFVKETIKSVIDQEYLNIELIVIDDGSSDKSVQRISEMINACKKRFYRFEFRYRSNKGLCATLNEGLEWAVGEYISAVASDDLLMPYKIKYQVELMRKLDDKCLGAFGLAGKVNERGKHLGYLGSRDAKKYSFFDIYMHRHNLPACTQILKTYAIRKAGGFPVEFKIEDWFMWLKLTNNNDNYLMYSPVVLSSYRLHADNTSSNTELMHIERLKIAGYEEWVISPAARKRSMAICFLMSSIEERKISLKLYYLAGAMKTSMAAMFEKKFLISLIRLFK